MVNGVRHSLDLVALIAYFKLKKKCQGQCYFLHSSSVQITNCMGYSYVSVFITVPFLQAITIFTGDSVNWCMLGECIPTSIW